MSVESKRTALRAYIDAVERGDRTAQRAFGAANARRDLRVRGPALRRTVVRGV